MKLLEGKSAVITGSSRGIGRAIAKAFADNGVSLVIHGTSEKTLAPLADELGCKFVAGDIGELSTSQRLAEKCMSEFGKIDILVNNAGINTRTKFLELEPDEWDRVIRTNLTGTFYACKCVIPFMLERHSGSIINMSSRAAKTAHGNASLCYGASKGGIDALTRNLAGEFAPDGIRVNSICPGPVETDMSLQWTNEYREKVLGNIPMRRLGKAEDIAELAVFLASDLSGFITGESININGGNYMN
ncbi:MAG: 3-oxoacyl-ACP reductase FabG [Synergistaceae bacterium]|nr:3-oxoacyl-ACP reductase FabG [Synergistaceae bacterium]MBQ9574208.1 3-oxoacyl-ACP reductase FabG [Synergistaceae bacterium]